MDQAPAFVIPVFRSLGGGNALLAQRIDSGDLIAAFDTVEGDGARLVMTEACEACVGSPALWAFQFDENRVEVAQRARLTPKLLEALPDFAFLPLLCVQILEFCRSPDVGPAYAAAHAKLEALAPGSGDLWRDLEVLSPQVRRALFRGLLRPSAESVRDLYDVTVLGQSGALEVRIPSALLERLDGQRGAAELLRPLRPTLRDLSLGKLDIVALDRSFPQREAGASPATLHQHVLTVVSLGPKAAGAIAGATRRLGVRTLPPTLVLGENDRLRPELGAVAGELFLLVLDEHTEWLSYGAKLIEALSGRGCLVDVVIVRASLPEPGQDVRRARQDLELRYRHMAQKARWVSVIGGGQSLGGNLKPLVAGAEPTRNSPTLLMKRLIQALAAAPSAGAAGEEVMRILHAKARGPKFGALGTGAADGAEATERAVRAAYASAERATPRPDRSREIALFVLHGPGARPDSVNVALETARLLSGSAEVHVVGVPHRQLKSRVQVTLVARGFAQSGAWLPPQHMTELADAGWRWGHHLPEVDVLEYYISREDAEFVLRSELDIKMDAAMAERIIDETPMYRGPVALLLSADPAPEVQATLRRAAIFTLVEGRVREFDEVAAEPYRFMLDALLAVPPQEALRSFRVIARDITMREFWQDEPYVRLNDPDDYVPGWLYDSEPPEGVVEGLDLRRAKQERSLHLRGVLRLTPHPSRAGHPVAYQFWLVVDYAGLRLTRRMVKLTDEPPGDEQRQLPL